GCLSTLEDTLVETPQADHSVRNQVKPSRGKRVMKYIDAAVCYGASVVFDTIQYFNRFSPNPSFTPKWTEKPLLKSWQKTKPVLGWPRQTDSLCPQCVKEAREAIISGTIDYTLSHTQLFRALNANILEKDSLILIVNPS